MLWKGLLVAGLIGLTAAPASAQPWWVPTIFDLSTAWGLELRTVDAGAGWELFSGPYGAVAIIGGVAAVERGLEPGYSWSEDKTRIFDDSTGEQVDPRTARTDPLVRGWARVEYQRDHFGATAMWDPRQHFALGVFGGFGLTDRSHVILELRAVEGLGSDLFSHDLSVRLRWR